MVLMAIPLTEKEKKEGKVERLLPGNLIALREIDDSPNIAIARLLEENRQYRETFKYLTTELIGSVMDDRIKLPFELMQKTFTAEELGNIVEARMNKLLSPFIEG